MSEFQEGQIVRERHNPECMWTIAPHLYCIQNGKARRVSEGSKTRVDIVELVNAEYDWFEPIDPLLEAVIRANLKEGM